MSLDELMPPRPTMAQLAGALEDAGLLCGALGDAGLLCGASSDGAGGARAIEGIGYDSRQAGPGWLFVCKGAGFKADYLLDAVERGAAAFVYEQGALPSELLAGLPSRKDGGRVAALCVNDVRKSLPVIANLFYAEAWRSLKLVAITGTKGKSTTAYYVKSILDSWMAELGRPPAAILSSIDTWDGRLSYESHLTTPEVFELHRHFANARDSGISHLVMEASSQALKYGRTDGVAFDVGCLLNIGEDHISEIEHPDHQDYVASKLLLFEQSKRAVVNLGAADAQLIMDAALSALAPGDVVSFSSNPGAAADFNSQGVRPCRQDGVDGSAFSVRGFSDEFFLGMTGVFNVDNALAAIAIASCLGVPAPHVHAGLAAARAAGRMEVLHMPNGAVVIIDYAHNKMSFEALFASVAAEYPGTRRTVVFGCPGYKALVRRRDLGTLAGRFCDMTWLTEEDAGYEPVADICADIAGHVAAAGGKCRIEPDREQAIAQALLDADGDTVVMLTGKGRETRQKRGSEYVEVASDLAIAQACIAAL
jgi:UDP-N-acetylmuramoyl-L-alanyl-D-glutamate--2,6-diaminopimelate ligase